MPEVDPKRSTLPIREAGGCPERAVGYGGDRRLHRGGAGGRAGRRRGLGRQLGEQVVRRSIDRSIEVSGLVRLLQDPVVVVDNLVVIFKSDEGCTQLT